MGNREILIVEDNPADVRLMREALKETAPPVNIHVAADGEEALQFLRRQGPYGGAPVPAMVFLDYNLPGASSRDVLREIKSDETLRPIPVIVLTTSDVPSDVREAYRMHANCYVRKPSDLESFFSTIQATAHFWLNIACVAAGVEVQTIR